VLAAWRDRLKPWATRLKVGVSLAILVLLLSQINAVRVVALWREVRLAWALGAVLLVAPNLFCQFQRWYVGLRRASSSVSAHLTFRTLLIGLAIGALTPGRVGELGQVVYLPQGSRRRALGVMGVVKVYSLVSTIALGAVMLVLMPTITGLAPVVGRVIAVIFLAALVLVVGFMEYLFRSTDHPRIRRLIDRIPGAPPVLLGVQALKPVDRVRFFLWSIGLSLVYLTQLVWLMRAFGGSVTWFDGLGAGAVTMGIVALLPIAFGNVGVRETAAVVIWHSLGITSPVAFNAAFTLFLMNVVAPGLAGLLWDALLSRKTHTTTAACANDIPASSGVAPEMGDRLP